MTKIVKKNTLIQKSTMASRSYNLRTIYIVDTIYKVILREFYIYFLLVYVLHCTQQYMGNKGKKINLKIKN